MRLSRSKPNVVSWLLLSLFSVVSSWIGWYHDSGTIAYAAPALMSLLMLSWLPSSAEFRSQQFYRIAWYLQLSLLLAALVPLGLLLWSSFGS